MRRRIPIGAVVTLAVLLGVGLWAAGPLLSPTLRDRIVATLGERFGGNAELKDLQVRILPRPRVTGGGLVIRHRGRMDLPPLIEVERFEADAGWVGLLRRPRHITSIRLHRLRLHIPPKSAGSPFRRQPPSTSSTPTQASSPKPTPVIVDRIVSTDATLSIAPKVSWKPPRVFALRSLDMTSVALDRPMAFSATLTNPKPPGEITTKGSFGPWAPREPADTPVRGEYTFTKADLGVFKGIAGILSSTGTYDGVLERIRVKGETATPDFQLTAARNLVALKTTFVAIVDGTNGNTELQPVVASFRRSTIVARGGVIRTPDKRGRVVSLDAAIDKARIEDLLRLAVKGEKPLMTGGAHVRTRLVIPPGEEDIVDKLELDGTFHIASATFTDVDVQKTLAGLSQRARGRPSEAVRGDSVVSDLKGRFTMRDGRIRFSELTFAIPGATVRLAGSYAIKAEQLDFRGTLRMQAKVSETVTGFKSVLLKVIDPLFRKRGAGAEVPIHISGSRHKPSFGLDVGRVLSRE
jgi:AsmA-like C-terminal region